MRSIERKTCENKTVLRAQEERRKQIRRHASKCSTRRHKPARVQTEHRELELAKEQKL